MKKYPMLMTPVSKQIIWGGDRLKREYGKVADFDKIAESWELSCRDNAMCAIANGEYAKMSLGDYIAEDRTGILGTAAVKYDRFPLLIKLIDAADRLSIQVHPDNEYSLAHEGELGKTEMWYIVSANEGAKLVYGLKDGCSREDFAKAVAEDRTEEMLDFVDVHAGETYFIPSGQVHAIGAGILIAEIQQNSDVTYRVYDYKRRQPDGSLRQLHTAKALDVIKLRTSEEINALRFSESCADGGEVLASCEYFTVRRYALNGIETLTAREESFVALLFTDAEDAEITFDGTHYPVRKGESWFIPAGSGEFALRGKADVIVSEIN